MAAPFSDQNQALPKLGFDPVRLLGYLRRRWWIPVLVMVMAAGAQALYLMLQRPGFTGTGRMWVGGKVRLQEGALYSEEWQNFFGTQIELMESSKIRQRAYNRLRALNGNTNASPIKITVTQPRKTTIFVLQGAGSDANYLEAYLNAVMDEYLSYKREVRSGSSDDTLSSLTEQLERSEKELKTEQEKLHTFQRENNLEVLQQESVSAGNYLTKLNILLADLKLEYELRGLLSTNPVAGPFDPSNVSLLQVDARRRGDPSPIAVTPPPEYLAAKQQLELLKLQRTELAEIYLSKHPKMIKVEEDIARYARLVDVWRDQRREQRDAYREDNQDELAFSKETLKIKVQSVEEAIRTWEGKVIEANRRVSDFERYKVNVERATAHYERLLRLLQNVDVNKNLDQESVTILDRAAVIPTPRRLPLKVALTALVGLICGFGLVLFLVNKDDRILCAAELRQQFEERVLGQIPQIGPNRTNGSLQQIQAMYESHEFAEAFRVLRSALLYLEKKQNPPQTLLVTSALPEEGKTSIALNLARSLALAGSKVLLIDGDTRCADLAALLNLPKSPGFTDLHFEGMDHQELILPTAVPDLFFLPAGRPAGHPGELFLSSRTDLLLKKVTEEYDFVVIDSAPVLLAADVSNLAPKVDGILFVVRSNFAGRASVRESLELLYERRGRVLGFILNRATLIKKNYYGYRYEKASQMPAETQS